MASRANDQRIRRVGFAVFFGELMDLVKEHWGKENH